MLRTGRASHDGRYERAADARIQPRGPRPAGLPIMVGAGGPQMLRLTAELADRWNGGLVTMAETVAALANLDAACAAVGRDPLSIERSVEVLIRPGAGPADTPLEPTELRGAPDAIAEQLTAYAELGLAELQVQLRPNTLGAIKAFGPVIEAIRRR